MFSRLTGIFQKDRDAMSANRSLIRRAGTLREQGAFRQSDGLLIDPAGPPNFRRDLHIIGMKDPDAALGKVLMANGIRGLCSNRLNHVGL
jgi:hypothetical protein